MRPWLAVVSCILISPWPGWADCRDFPHDQFDFWIGTWHDPATPVGEQYEVRRTAGGCAIEEVLIGGNGEVRGIGLAGWDSEREQWRQLWTDADRFVTVYVGGPGPDGTFVLTSEPKKGGAQWRYTYLNIRPDSIDAEYASRGGKHESWVTVWSGRFDREGTASR